MGSEMCIRDSSDADRLARHFSLTFADTRCQPTNAHREQATRILLAAIEDGQFVDQAARVSLALWSNGADAVGSAGSREATGDAAAAHLRASDALRQKWGHYLGATLYYGGEWYWGVDRLYHLEQRLQALGLRREGAQSPMFPPSADLAAPVPVANPSPIDFFFSLRSPYSVSYTHLTLPTIYSV